MSSKKTANQHYVPQIYLESFTDNAKCYVYNKNNGKHFPTTPRNILARRYLYDFDFLKYKDVLANKAEINIENFPSEQACEKILGEVEGFYKRIQNNIDSNYNWFENYFNRLIVYQLIAIQMVRTPQAKKILFDTYKNIKPDISEELENLFFLKEIIDTINCKKVPVVLEWFLQDFSNLRIGINTTKIPFITSDNPVIFIPGRKEKGNYEVFYPITPNRCILLCPYKKVDRRKIRYETRNDFSNGTLKLVNSYDIIQEAFRREENLLEKLNPSIEEIDKEKDVLIFNTMMYDVANEYIVSNVDITENKIYIDEAIK